MPDFRQWCGSVSNHPQVFQHDMKSFVSPRVQRLHLAPLVWCLIALLACAGGTRALATLANAWHIPDNSTDLGGTHMRDPWFEISNNPALPTTVTIYSGVQKFSNSFGTANQTGG